MRIGKWNQLTFLIRILTYKALWEKIEQQKEDSSNRISQLEACLTTALDKFEEYIHHAIQACTGKKAGKILKNEIKTLKEEKNKLKRDTGEKEVLVDGQTGKIHNYMNKTGMLETETLQTRKYQPRQDVSIETRNRFAALQNTQE